jgi:AraC family transcriptional regulator of adaptative response/methylated-DNA-[protein]-cysteine methyltransferase
MGAPAAANTRDLVPRPFHRKEIMHEILRHAWGTSSLGKFLVVASDKGVVAFEFGSGAAALEAALAERFPDADIIADPHALASVVAKLRMLVDAPASDPQLAIDLRGSPYELRVWSMLREIPAGQTTHYGALAAQLGTRDARDVTVAIGANPVAILVPCHRVIKKDGSISGYRWGVSRKRTLLERERALGDRLL